MPIISPKCPKNYKLLKSQCKCKKKTAKTKKKKKVVKKPKQQTKKVDKHLETKKKLAQEIIDLHVSLGLKTGKLTTLTQLVKLNVTDLRKDVKKYKKMVRTKVRNVKKAVKQQEKRETKKKKVIKKKETKKNIKRKKVKKRKTIKQIREECKKNGLVFDTHTRKCREKKQRKKTKRVVKLKSKTTRKIKTPKPDIHVKKTPKPDIHVKSTPKQQQNIMMSRLRSYSPSINKLITRKSVDQLKLTGYGCKENEIRIGGGECLVWKNKKTEELLLNNLQSKKPVKASDVLGPNQNDSNCWFNTFFMLFFITDKGRKFMKNFRRAMITGNITPNGKKKIPQKLRYPFWLLNKMVEASLVGRRDPDNYASLMDTNDVIKKIYNNLKSPNKKTGFYRKPGQAGNPVLMFEKIMDFFKKGKNKTDFGLEWENYRIISNYSWFSDLTQKNSFIYKDIVSNKPKMIVVEISDQNKGANGYKGKGEAKVSDFKKKLSYKFGGLEYKLDSVGVRDVDKNHICALLTINGQDYMFDGENTTPLYKKKWRHLLNKNETFKITPDISERYNFTKSYQCLIYYRHK